VCPAPWARGFPEQNPPNLLLDSALAGNLVSDAHLAALAIEHRAEIVTHDTDFARFAGLNWRRPV